MRLRLRPSSPLRRLGGRVTLGGHEPAEGGHHVTPAGGPALVVVPGRQGFPSALRGLDPLRREPALSHPNWNLTIGDDGEIPAAEGKSMAGHCNINDLLDGHVGLDLECLDRIYLNAYVPT